MYTERLLDHFRHPRNAGELPPPATVVEVSNPACGDVLRLSAVWEDGRAVAVAYKSRGCTAAIGAGSALTELMLGRSRDELAGIRAADVEAAVGGLAPPSKHAAVLCADAVKALLTSLK